MSDDLTLRRGESVTSQNGSTLRVTQLDIDVLPRIRAVLIEAARRGKTLTYGELKHLAELSHARNGLSRLLDLVHVDCRRRPDPEPSLDALVVNARTGEVGQGFMGDPSAEREALARWWQT